jgi:hypothetical protein
VLRRTLHNSCTTRLHLPLRQLPADSLCLSGNAIARVVAGIHISFCYCRRGHKKSRIVSVKIPILQFLVLVVIVWFGSLQNTHAVNKPPDGGYPLGNTTEGDDALFSLTANGAANTAIGAHALYFNTTGDDNTAVGFVALNFNTTGSKNTALGYHALFSNQTGRANTAGHRF